MSTKHVLFYSPFAGFCPHFETELDLMQQYLDRGYRVTVLTCQGELPSCEVNPKHTLGKCWNCKSRQVRGLDWIGRDRVQVKNFYWIKSEQKEKIESHKNAEFESISDLKNFKIEGSDIGLAALSSTISQLREPQPDILSQHRSILRKHIEAASIVHYSLTNHFNDLNPDEFIIFNGRFSSLRPALRVSQALGIKTYVHELGAELNQYSLFEDRYPHDLEYYKGLIESSYALDKYSEVEKKDLAIQWFKNRQSNVALGGFYDFTRRQKSGTLPESLTNNKLNIVIFNSSEDEFTAIEGWDNLLYIDQNDGILKILNDFQKESKVRFFLRMHPNLSKINNSQTNFLDKMLGGFENLEIIPCDSPISTYSLIDACDVVITFGSTVGIEAVYQKKPSILLGRAVYEDLGSIIKPATHEELVLLLKMCILNQAGPEFELSNETIYKYGFFQKTSGVNLSYSERSSLFRVKFTRNESNRYKETFSLKANFLSRVLSKLGL